MNEAYVFQHKYTGVQIFVYHAKDIEDAKYKFKYIVIKPEDWVYLDKKISLYTSQIKN